MPIKEFRNAINETVTIIVSQDGMLIDDGDNKIALLWKDGTPLREVAVFFRECASTVESAIPEKPLYN